MKVFQPGDVPDTYADVDDLVEQFGYKPSMSVKQGVKNFSLWYQDYNNIEPWIAFLDLFDIDFQKLNNKIRWPALMLVNIDL